MADHPYIVSLDELAYAHPDLTARENLIVMCLLRYGDWHARAEARPGVDMLARWARCTERQVYRILDRLTCPTPVREPSGALRPCLRCGHADILVSGTNPAPGRAVAYAVFLGLSQQAMLPERDWGARSGAATPDVSEANA